MAKTPPTPKKTSRRGAGVAITAKQRETFLERLAAGYSVSHASTAARINRQTAYAHRDRDPAFAAAWEAALDAGTQALEDEAVRRATSGDKPSDVLLIFLLKARRPDVYRDRIEHTGAGGGPVEVKLSFDPGAAA